MEALLIGFQSELDRRKAGVPPVKRGPSVLNPTRDCVLGGVKHKGSRDGNSVKAPTAAEDGR